MKKLLIFTLFLFSVQISEGQEGVRYVRKDTTNAVNTSTKTVVNQEKTAVKDSTSRNTNIQQNPKKTNSKPKK